MDTDGWAAQAGCCCCCCCLVLLALGKLLLLLLHCSMEKGEELSDGENMKATEIFAPNIVDRRLLGSCCCCLLLLALGKLLLY